MRYTLFAITYLLLDIPICHLVNIHIEKWLLERAYDKWGVRKYHNMTKKQKDWFESRQTFYETSWDIILGVMMIWILIYVFGLDHVQ